MILSYCLCISIQNVQYLFHLEIGHLFSCKMAVYRLRLFSFSHPKMRCLCIHYANTPMQYTAIFHGCKNVHFQMIFFYIFFLFLLKTLIVGVRENHLSEAVLMSTHNLCFRAKIRKKVYPCKPQFYYIQTGCKGVFVTRTCFRDVHVHMYVIIFFTHMSYLM